MHDIRKCSITIFLLFILVNSSSVYAAFSQKFEPSKQDEQKLSIWQLAWWQDYKTACTMYLPLNTSPSNDDVISTCGSDLFTQWQTTPACHRDYSKNGDSSACTGLFLRNIGTISQSELQIQKNETPSALSGMTIQTSNVNCQIGELCAEKPELLLHAVSPDGTAVQKIHIRISSFEGECAGDTCRMVLPETGEQGEWLEYWTMDSNGNQGEHFWLKFRVVPKQTGYRYDLIGDEYKKGSPPGSNYWYVFTNSNTETARELEQPYSPDYLITTNKLSILAAKLIQTGAVSAGDCINYGILTDGSANGCGMNAAADQMYQYQNKYNQQIYNAGVNHSIPARLLKGLIMQESQFWPHSSVKNEYGFGMITENGIDMLLTWNRDYFLRVCLDAYAKDQNRCQAGYTSFSDDERNILRGYTLRNIGSEAEIDLLGAALQASALQVNQLVKNATEKPVSESTTYEDMWKFTIANYYTGSGCIYNAMLVTIAYGYQLTWDNTKTFLSGQCLIARDYVDRVYDYSK